MHFTGTQYLASILMLAKPNTCLVRMEASLLMQCIITDTRSNQIKHTIIKQRIGFTTHG